jgi:hypothetical protein
MQRSERGRQSYFLVQFKNIRACSHINTRCARAFIGGDELGAIIAVAPAQFAARTASMNCWRCCTVKTFRKAEVLHRCLAAPSVVQSARSNAIVTLKSA